MTAPKQKPKESKTIAKKRPNDSFDLLCKALKTYLREQGWELVVAGRPEIRQSSQSGKYNYEFALKITAGRKIHEGQTKAQRKAQRKAKANARRHSL